VSGTIFYLSGLAILFGINLIAVWGLDLQFGVTGINSFAFIVFQSAGAYATGVLALKPPSAYGSFETYIGGANLPFPLPLIGGALAGALIAVPLGLIAVRRLRGDYEAMALLVVSLIATGLVNAQTHWFNGPSGIALVPQPFGGPTVAPQTYHWIFLAITAVCCAIAWWVVRGISRAPLGRLLRACRESESAAAALGRSPLRLRMIALVIGGALAGLSGGLLVEYVTAWSPASWLYQETFLFFTALVVGGRGNLAGAALGVLIVPIGIAEATRRLPSFGYPGLIDALDLVAVGAMMLLFLWFRPNGLLAERKRVIRDRNQDGSQMPGEAGIAAPLRLRRSEAQ
jgi:branched-chain amino acid transport system permease protein